MRELGRSHRAHITNRHVPLFISWVTAARVPPQWDWDCALIWAPASIFPTFFGCVGRPAFAPAVLGLLFAGTAAAFLVTRSFALNLWNIYFHVSRVNDLM